MQAVLDAAQVLLPGIFVVLVTWLGARLVVAGRDRGRRPGRCSTGCPPSWSRPLRTATEMVDRLTRAHIGARRIINVLRVSPYVLDRTPGRRVDLSDAAPLHDPTSGATLPAGRLTAVVSPPPGGVRRAGRPARPVRRGARRRRCCCGDERIDLHPAARDAPPGRGQRERPAAVHRRRCATSWSARRAPSDDEVARARSTPPRAHDVLDALPDGLDSQVEERGRSFSGGQRQRLVAGPRAADATRPTLVLVEPTSAVDAHTEARIASRCGPTGPAAPPS